MTIPTNTHPTLRAAFENLPDSGGLTKIITQTLRDERGTDVGMAFARADNGLVIGAATRGTSQFGHEPHQESQFFLSQRHAVDYVKGLCRIYLGRDDVDFLVQEAETPVSLVRPHDGPKVRM